MLFKNVLPFIGLLGLSQAVPSEVERRDDYCAAFSDIVEIHISTSVQTYPVEINNYYEADTVINIYGGITIDITNAPTQFSTVVTATVTSTVTSITTVNAAAASAAAEANIAINLSLGAVQASIAANNAAQASSAASLSSAASSLSAAASSVSASVAAASSASIASAAAAASSASVAATNSAQASAASAASVSAASASSAAIAGSVSTTTATTTATTTIAPGAANAGAPFVLAFDLTVAGKRAIQQNYIGEGGAAVTDIGDAVIFIIESDRIQNTGRFISTNSATGYSAFALFSAIEEISTIFADISGLLSWVNSAFLNGAAEFFFANGFVGSSFDGSLPNGATIITLRIVPPFSGNSTTSASTIPASSSSISGSPLSSGSSVGNSTASATNSPTSGSSSSGSSANSTASATGSSTASATDTGASNGIFPSSSTSGLFSSTNSTSIASTTGGTSTEPANNTAATTTSTATTSTGVLLNAGTGTNNAKRAIYTNYIGAGGAITTDSASAILFNIVNGQLTSDGEYVSTQPGSSNAPFTLSAVIQSISTVFSNVGGALTWANNAFTGGVAGFYVQNGVVGSYFDGVLPPSASAVQLGVISTTRDPSSTTSSSSSATSTGEGSTTTGPSSSSSSSTGTSIDSTTSPTSTDSTTSPTSTSSTTSDTSSSTSSTVSAGPTPTDVTNGTSTSKFRLKRHAEYLNYI